MKRGWLILFCVPCLAMAQWAGKGTVNGVGFRYETRLEPGQPAIANIRNGLFVEKGQVAKRFFCDYNTKRCYGYDFSFAPAGGDAYQMKLMPLTLSPQEEAALFQQQSGWTRVPFEKGNAVQTVRVGDTVAMDLFVNVSTRQKIVEYLTLVKDEQLRAEGKVRPAPALTVTGADGRDLTAVVPGKVCAVLFLMTNCNHCGPASEMLSRLQVEFGTRVLHVAGVAVNPDAPIAQYVRDHNLQFPVGAGVLANWRQFLNLGSNERMLVPALALVDQKGNIVQQWQGDKLPVELELRQTIQAMLNAR